MGGVPIPFDIADVGAGTEARGLGALGRGISNLSQALGQIEQAEGVSQASTAMGQVDSEIRLLNERLRNNNDPKTYDAELQKTLEKIKAFTPENQIGAKRFDDFVSQSIPKWESSVIVLGIRKKQDLIEGAYIGDWNSAIQKGNLSEADRLTIEARDITGVLTPQEAAKRLNESPVLVNKVLEGNAIQFLKDSATLNPQTVKDAVILELNSRKKGKEPSDEFVLLSNTDLKGIIDYANTIGEKQKNQSEVNLEAALVNGYGQIRDNDAIDIDALIDKNNLDPNQTDEDKIKFAEKIPTYFRKINSTKVADESDEDVYDELTQATESVERGALSPADFEELYADKKDKLDKDDQRTIRSRDIVATKTMQNRTFSDALIATRPVLVELTLNDLGAIKLASEQAELIKDLPTVNLFNIATKKNQAERWNFGRFRKELRSQIAQNPNWSQKQIFVAQEVLTDQLDMPVDELLKSFDAQNPKSSILAKPPDLNFKDIWPDLSIDDKAKIWELRMRGASPATILGEFQ
ncbi:MAG: hypothetical protein ACUZ9M_00640 [Candidatus Scalindua sp.]